MSISVDVVFPGGKKVDAVINGFTVHTDQKKEAGGDGTAAQPFDLFFVSLATCAGIYALEFCLTRSIDTTGLAVRLNAEKSDEKSRVYDKIVIVLTLPGNFPEKYRDAIVRAVDLCTVKKQIQSEIHFEVEVRREK